MATQGTTYPPHSAIEYRLWDRVQDDPETGCWEWQGSTAHGYGQILWKGRTRKVHRVAYELLRGPIPDDLTVDHLCRNRCCVNPAHFELVPLKVNQSRMVARCSKITHCPQGHAYNSENTYVDPRGKRRCRTCRRVQQRKSYRRAA